MKIRIVILFITLLFSCKEATRSLTFFKPANDFFNYSGRIEMQPDSTVALINSAASVSFTVIGDTTNIMLSCLGNAHNYVSLVVNDIYQGRIKINPIDVNHIPLKLANSDTSKIQIFKATEASNGSVLFQGANAHSLIPTLEVNSYSIEFIGNSITCGMGADTTDIPCEKGLWYDQHNAYLSYAVRSAQALDASFILNSVSGIGVYRNWNDENILERTMPQVYDNLYLNSDSTLKYSNSAHPDLISICLGTNDLSDGDGVKDRLDFNKDKFIENYTAFVATIFTQHPKAKLALLTSPMISGKKGELFLECLEQVKSNFNEGHSISIFEFDAITPTGCSYHPLSIEHEQMAEQLIPFYKSLLDQKP